MLHALFEGHGYKTVAGGERFVAHFLYASGNRHFRESLATCKDTAAKLGNVIGQNYVGQYRTAFKRRRAYAQRMTFGNLRRKYDFCKHRLDSLGAAQPAVVRAYVKSVFADYFDLCAQSNFGKISRSRKDAGIDCLNVLVQSEGSLLARRVEHDFRKALVVNNAVLGREIGICRVDFYVLQRASENAANIEYSDLGAYGEFSDRILFSRCQTARRICRVPIEVDSESVRFKRGAAHSSV